MKHKEYKYWTKNTSLKKIAKIYPYNNSLFANVYFYILNNNYDVESLDNLIMGFDKQINGMSEIDDSDIFDDENVAFNIDKLVDNITDDDIDDDDYIESLYEEYTECVEIYMTDVLSCDMVFGIKLIISDGVRTYQEIINDNENDSIISVMIGVRFSNPIDEKLYDTFKTILINDDMYLESYNDVRKLNVDILSNSINDNRLVMSNLINTIIEIITNYVQEYYQYNNIEGTEILKISLENGSTAYIEPNIEGFFPLNRFKLSFNLNSYNINEYMLTKVLDNVYAHILRFGNALNIMLKSNENIEIFKYDNDTKSCILIKNDAGCTYLFLDGWKSK